MEKALNSNQVYMRSIVLPFSSSSRSSSTPARRDAGCDDGAVREDSDDVGPLTDNLNRNLVRKSASSGPQCAGALDDGANAAPAVSKKELKRRAYFARKARLRAEQQNREQQGEPEPAPASAIPAADAQATTVSASVSRDVGTGTTTRRRTGRPQVDGVKVSSTADSRQDEPSQHEPKPRPAARLKRRGTAGWREYFWLVWEHEKRAHSSNPLRAAFTTMMRCYTLLWSVGLVDEYFMPAAHATGGGEPALELVAFSHSVVRGRVLRGMWFYQSQRASNSKALLWFHALAMHMHRATSMRLQAVDIGPSMSSAVLATKKRYGFDTIDDWNVSLRYEGDFVDVPLALRKPGLHPARLPCAKV